LDIERVAVLGAGRMGQGLALALRQGGLPALLWGRRTRAVVGDLPLQTGPVAKAIGRDGVVLLAVPDSAIAVIAADLAACGVLGPRHVVLHLSGLLDRTALAPLEPSGAALGSFHPLQTVADPVTAPERLQGSWVGIEGDPTAVATGLALAARLGLHPIELTAAQKPAYHAAAVMVANYVVTLVDTASRMVREAGIPAEAAARLYQPLLAGVTLNLAGSDPVRALTGPIVRGDVATVRRHLAALSGEDRRLYGELGRATLAVAVRAGLAPGTAAELGRLLGEATGR
jgi:predicted short-subunit dehydrogenase-like oxidoreductase (DUF2520 family)